MSIYKITIAINTDTGDYEMQLGDGSTDKKYSALTIIEMLRRVIKDFGDQSGAAPILKGDTPLPASRNDN